MWLGQWKNNEHTPFGLKWPKEPVPSLGIEKKKKHNHRRKIGNAGRKL